MVCIGTDGPGAAVLDRVRQTAHVGVVAITDADVRPLLSNVALISERNIEGLNARIRNVLRHNRIGTQTTHRGSNSEAKRRRKIGDLEVDVVSRRVFLCGNAVAVTRIEFSILKALSACPGEPLTCRQLAEFVWGRSVTGGRSALGVHVGRLRRKLGEDSASPRYLRTVRGVGYCLGG
ncbi:response regulator transcription factor [Mycobacterium sp. 29Ha]|uniref:winged helix-turn-helix transcriptional regulator n=1 Tax=Mycobacterium sp. 29Ha TaxID=2939268 RepID=UPI0029392FBC|nr:response regulator transcription factor [Mycobacterium sp. 29Ha]MDV3131324.1 response regulator transcription factor [Mycobacterium sp. 29Ha]